MPKSLWLLSSALVALATPVFAQAAPERTMPTATEMGGGVDTPTDAAPVSAADAENDPGEIVVTATRRASPLSDVPIAVSAVTATALQNTGATDIRGLNQLTPSLFVSSSSSEAVGAVARIRGIGTVGDNPGLESSVATFIDGVYRSRSGVALTELGAVERIEVLRGPQGTLFGRNASAGLINVVTAGPSFDEGGNAELSLGNYDYRRALVGLTGPINDKVAYRVDGVYTKRDGFMKESDDYAGSSGRRFNNRDRWLARGQLLFKPTEDISFRLIGDYARRDEDCCAATYAPARDVVRNPADGSIGFGPSSFAAFERSLGAVINEDIYARRVSVTPGRSFQSDVRDWGLSGELNWDFGAARLTSITSYRDWRSDRGQDADFNNLDILYRTDLDQQFKTFTQEFRLQGKAFADKLDWLVGAYFAAETLHLSDNLRYGADYGLLQGCRIASALPAGLQPFVTPGEAACLNAIGRAALAGSSPAGPTLLAGLTALSNIGDEGATRDTYRQKDRTWALFTHNVIALTDRLSLTLGARYTHDRKTLDADIASDSAVCAQQRALLGPLAANPLAAGVIGFSCANSIAGASAGASPGIDGSYQDRISDNEWTGTVVLSFKPTDRLLTYASYSRGYKAGGFNLDRAGFLFGTPAAPQLRFGAEKVASYEVGAKYRGRGFRLAGALFYELFDDFQLNTFNGVSFIVENIAGCSELVGGSGTDSDLNGATGACSGKAKAGVVSRGLELEGSFYPTSELSVDLGLTYAKTDYRKDLSGKDGAPLPSALFVLPGSALSNAPRFTGTAGGTWTPPLSGEGLSGLLHADLRYQSKISTGSDLLPEKAQKGVAIINARVGLTGGHGEWGVELWAQNLFDANYRQTTSGAPLQGSGSLATVQAGGASPGTSLFIVFPAEPRTFGLTARTRF